MKQFSATLLAIVHLLSALMLLGLSAWFIAACAISGHAGVLAGFNYVIPATLIRFLAVIRLASGYFEKYFGHLALLQQLKWIRRNLLTRAFAHHQIKQSNAAITLQQESEQAAARWSAIYSPLLASLGTGLGISLMMVIFFPVLLPQWLGYLGVAVLLLVVFRQLSRRSEKKAQQQLQLYLFNQRQWLHTSTLWPLTEQQQSITNLTQQALEANHKRRKQQELLVWAETMLITLSLIWLILFAHQLTDLQKDHAIWAVPFIFLVAVRDWLLPAFTALSQAQGSHWQPDETAFASPQDMEPEAANNISIQLEQFQWCRGKRCGPVLNFKHQGPGIVLFSAPSGSGKSSTFSALVGELAFQGQAMINGQSAQNMSASQRHQQIHYVEQFGHIFSATLGENLTLAAHKPDSELIAALNWAGLNDWANKSALQQWIGEGGRPISGGEQKRLLLARAYLSDAPILLLDEPFEALDHSTTQIIAQRLTAMSQIRLILIATHIKPDGLDVSQVLQCDLLPQ